MTKRKTYVHHLFCKIERGRFDDGAHMYVGPCGHVTAEAGGARAAIVEMLRQTSPGEYGLVDCDGATYVAVRCPGGAEAFDEIFRRTSEDGFFLDAGDVYPIDEMALSIDDFFPAEAA